MLEFKDISIITSKGEPSKPFSLVVDKGDIVCLSGNHGSGKSLILRAILGLEPISNGFITVDGELVTPGSSSYFRKMMAYIPQNLPHDNIRVSELVNEVFCLQSNKSPRMDPRNLLSEWQLMGIDKSLFDVTLDKLDNATIQMILLSFLPSLNKEIVLIDNLYQTEVTKNLVSQLVSTSKSEVIYTCQDSKIGYNKIVNL